jgi:hypothetical protein
MTMLVCPLLVLACVTINIYFPAEKVESVAGEIVSEIRGQESEENKDESKKNDKSSSLRQSLFAFWCSTAWADEITTVSNATIRALKQAMKNRYAQMRPFYQKGMLREGNDGYVSVNDAGELGLKQKRDLNNLVAAENKDRRKLYAEVAKALEIDPSQTGRVAEIFAKEWQKPVR